jgi:dTDP-glucose 4,6-dehydratase
METKKVKRICLSGVGGFVGSHLMSHLLKNTDYEIVGIASWRHKGMPTRVADDENYKKDISRVKIITHDLSAPITPDLIEKIGHIDIILNLASDSHVDRSITDPVPFVTNNVAIAVNMLEFARICKPELFVQFSTDESFGTAEDGVAYKEGDRHNAGNPYSASKDAQESICRAYANTFGLRINITNSMNIIGEFQDREKFAPLCIRKIFNDEVIQIHSNADLTKSGTRYYLHARNIAQAIQFIMEKTNENLDKIDASLGCWNIVGDAEIANDDFARMIGKIMGKEPKIELISFHSSRPGHDLAYRLDGRKLKKAGFSYPISFEDTLRKTIEWYLKPENSKWLL